MPRITGVGFNIRICSSILNQILNIEQHGYLVFHIIIKKIEFRTPESESDRNLTNYFVIFLLLFY